MDLENTHVQWDDSMNTFIRSKNVRHGKGLNEKQTNTKHITLHPRNTHKIQYNNLSFFSCTDSRWS